MAIAEQTGIGPPGALVHVLLPQTQTHAPIYSDSVGTPLANPTTADPVTGAWSFFADQVQPVYVVYDATLVLPQGSYTPAWTATTADPDIDDGTLTGRYTQTGKWVDFCITLIAGAGTTFGTGDWRFSLPVPALDVTVGRVLAHAYVESAGSGFVCQASAIDAETLQVLDAATDLPLEPAVPIAWAAGDTLTIAGRYEAA